MRLHLPKTLLAAVLAACASLDAYAGVSGSAFEINSTEINESESMSGYATFSDGTYTSINTDPAGKTAVTTIRPGDSTTGTIAQLNVASDKALSISANRTSNFTDLTISQINVAETGSATLNIAGAQVVKIGRASGIVNFAVSGAGAGELIFNGRGTYGNYTTTSDGNYTRKIQVTDSSTVTFDTITNSWGMGAIDVAAGSELNATSIILKSGDNSGGDLQGGKITGAGRVSATTLDAGNVGNYTVSVANFEAGTLNADWVDASKELTLSSSTLTIRTLNQTNGTIKITSATSAAITSLNISGGIIDASEMTGTLTISGATWTGNLTDASVEVLKAKDAATATSLANSMNTTHGLNYSFSVTESSVYRVRRTESLTGLTAKLQGNPGSRIVVDATYDGTTFTNVGLNELLAGDKVTIDGLTGWIGDNTSNSILADLEFTGQNHINNGSSSNSWITYSGAITGNGTLSYEWGTAAYTYNFNGNLSGFTGTISDTTTLNVTIGGTPAMDAAKAVNATIDIAGALTVNREASFAGSISVGGALIIDADATFSNTVQAGGNITVTSGVFRVEKSASTNAQLDLSNGGTSTGCVEIASGASLTVRTNIWGTSNDTFASKILLEKDANLVWNGFTITGKTAKDGVETGLKFGANNAILNSNNSAHSVTNSIITYTGTDEKTLSWQLVDTDLNVESGTVNLAGNSIGGNLTINAGTVKTSADSNKGVVGAHTVTINARGTLEASGIDAFGWEDGQKCTQIVMGGTAEDALAQLKLNSGSSWQTTLGTDVLLKGYSSIGGNSAFKTAGGKIKATGTNNVISASMCVMDDVEVEVTGATDTLQIDEIKYFHNYDSNAESSGTVSVTGEGTLSVGTVTRSALKNTGSGSVEVTGAVSDSTISNTGSGFVTLSGTADSKTKLISSGSNGSLTARGVSSLAEVKAENGGSVALIAAAGTSVSVADLTIGTNGQAQAYTSASDLGTVIADKVNIGESGAKFQGNLNITGGLTVQVGSNGQTGGLNMAAAFTSTATGTLTLGSATGTGLELNLSYIPVMTTGDTLTLFSGVGSVLYYEIISAETGGTESAAVTLSDPAPITLTADAVDASKVFNNVDSGFFTVKFVGNDVILTASSNVPEPTTATLSLLALMGLAARRRRRKA